MVSSPQPLSSKSMERSRGFGAGGLDDDVSVAGVGLACTRMQNGELAYRQARDLGTFVWIT
jgi:hypothetical protein